VSNTLISDNGADGIQINSTFSLSGGNPTTAVFDHVELENNANDGLYAFTALQTVKITVTDSVVANNGNIGIYAVSNNSSVTSIMVRNSTIADNLTGLYEQGPGSTILVTRSTITGNGTGWGNNSEGVLASYGDNNIDLNNSVNTAPPCVNGTSPCTAYK
jgi:hypothetical protein